MSKDGGPAFPGMDYINQAGKVNPPGMSLRDYFAAAALTGIMNTPNDLLWTVVASQAYDLADAMLKERER